MRLSAKVRPGISGLSPFQAAASTSHSQYRSTAASRMFSKLGLGQMRSTAQSAKPICSSRKAVSSWLKCFTTSFFKRVVVRRPFSQQTTFMGSVFPAWMRA